MAKNYSHCPLKKRPIQFLEEDVIVDKVSDENQEKPVDARKRICIRTPPPVKLGRFQQFKRENVFVIPQKFVLTC